MPTAPPRACARCGRPAQRGKPCVCKAPWEGTTHPHDDIHMAKLRTAKLATDPICQRSGCRHPATQVDHVIPLAEGGARYDWGNLQSLCAHHHAQKTTRDALRGKTRRR
jgi:5-methylcytosine-specific restriction protein A